MTSANASVDIIPSSSLGTFSSSTSDKQANFTVSTSNYTGYELQITADDDLGLLTNSNTGDTLASVSTATSEADFSANTTEAATNYNGKWGYKPNMFNSVANTNYLPAPTTAVSVLNHTTSANPTGTSDTYTISIGARTDYIKPSGTYTNAYTLTAVANPIAYAIEYYDISSNTYSNTVTFTQVATQASEVNTATSVTLTPDVTRTRSTYTFAGWCKGTDHSQVSVNDTTTYNTSSKTYSNPATVCNGTLYQTGDTMLIDPTVDNTNIKLYAVWAPTTFDQAYAAAGKAKDTTSGYNYYKMQDITTSICNSVTINQIATLVDSRVNGSYASRTNYIIAKLDDGKCWMLDNMRLDLTNSTVKSALTTSNTHVNSASLTSLKSGNRSNGARYATSGVANWTSSYSHSVPQVNKSGSCSTGNYCTYTGSYTYTDILSTKSGASDAVFGAGSGRIGVYYNYCAASAGNYCYGDGTDAGTSSGNATYDICPANWKLPTGGSSGEFLALYNQIDSNYYGTSSITTATDPLSFQFKLSTSLTGSYYQTSAEHQGENSEFWASTRDSDPWMKSVIVRKTSAAANSYRDRRMGLSVRCVSQ